MKSRTVRRPSSSLAVVTTPSGLWNASQRRSLSFTGRFPTVIRWRSGSTFIPSVAGFPSTRTWPSSISFSAARREATRPGPAPAGAASRSRFRLDVRRGVVHAFGDSTMRSERDGELLGFREVGEIAQAQQLEEERRRPVEERAAQSLAAARPPR